LTQTYTRSKFKQVDPTKLDLINPFIKFQMLLNESSQSYKTHKEKKSFISIKGYKQNYYFISTKTHEANL